MDGGAPNDRLIKLAEALADGASPDWERLRAEQPDEGGIKTLEQIQQIAQAFQSTAQDTPPQFVWKHLQVHEMIGNGGFGEVYRAFDPTLRRDVALKLRRADEDALPDRVFIQEARRLARVRHPNVLAVHGADRDSGRVGLWADLLPGQSLQHLVDRRGRLAQNQVLDIALALADALTAIHAAGLVHGDIKASNIMLQPNGTPILMDFGAAVDDSRAARSPTAGSPLVMAPELLAGAPLALASDQYSFGVLLYQLLTGRFPLAADHLDDLLAQHETAAPIDWLVIPQTLRPLLRQLLSTAPERRPSASQAFRLLDQIRTRPQRRRRRITIAAVIGSLALGLTAAGYGLYEAKRSERQALAARDEAEAARAESEDVTQFLVNLLQAPNTYSRSSTSTVTDLLDDAARELEYAPPEDPTRLVRYQFALAKAYDSFGQHEKAIALLESAIATLRTDQTRTAELVYGLVLLGRTAENADQLDRAKEVLVEAQALGETHLGETHIETISAIFRHAGIIRTSEGPQAAMPLMERALELAYRQPEEKQFVATVEAGLASLLLDLGELDQAESLARQALATTLELHEPSHVNVLSARNTLSAILARQGRYAEAEPLFRANLAVVEVRNPGGSPRSALMLLNLGAAVSEQGRREEALQITRRAREIMARTLGPTHPRTLLAGSNNAAQMFELGFVDEAESAYRNLIQSASEALGPDHGIVLINQSNLSELLLRSGHLTEAETLAGSTAAVSTRVLGDSSPFTLATAAYHGAALIRLGRLEDGREILEQTHTTTLKALGPENQVTIIAAAYLAEALLYSGEAGRAQTLLEKVVAWRTDTNGADHPKTAEAAALLERSIQ